MQPPTSAIPDFYYIAFAICEPALIIVSCLITVYDPKTVHNALAPWPADTSPPALLPITCIVAITQLARVCTTLGVLNIMVLTAVRKHLALQPALQEKIANAYLIPILIGDLLYLCVTLWAFGDDRWNVARWSPLMDVIIGSEVILSALRFVWYLGVGRYVDTRDRALKSHGTGGVQLGSQMKER